eukprot:COSAG03_NODE_76_length_14245_cov_10.406122_9_plen_1576_part_00
MLEGAGRQVPMCLESAAIDVARALGGGAETVGDFEALLASTAPNSNQALCTQPLPRGLLQVGVKRKVGDRVVVRHGLAEVKDVDDEEALGAGEVATVTENEEGQTHLTLRRESDHGEICGINAADLATATDGGQVLLHHAAASGCSVELLRAILELNASAAAVADNDGKVPLELALESGCKAEALTMLHAAEPAAVVLNSAAVAMWVGTVAETAADIEAILRIAPAGICAQPVPAGMLHVGVLRKKGDRVMVKHGLPEAQRRNGQLSGTLLAGEVAIVTNAWSSVDMALKRFSDNDQEDLGDEFNAADFATAMSGQLPLHEAAASGRSAAVLRALVAANDVAVSIANESGKLPFTLAIEAECSAEEALELLSFDAASILDSNGRYLLHHAAASGRSVELLRAILELNASAAAVADNDGKVPLELALESGCKAEALTMLHAAEPAAVVLNSAAVAMWVGTVAETAADIEAILRIAPAGICAQPVPAGMLHVGVLRKKGDRVMVKHGLAKLDGDNGTLFAGEVATVLYALGGGDTVALSVARPSHERRSTETNFLGDRTSDGNSGRSCDSSNADSDARDTGGTSDSTSNEDISNDSDCDSDSSDSSNGQTNLCKLRDLATASAGGQVLLHVAAANGRPTAVLRALLDADSAAASVADGNGRYPIHWAAYAKQTEEAMRLVLAGHAAAAGVRDSESHPIDIVAGYKSSEVPQLRYVGTVVATKPWQADAELTNSADLAEVVALTHRGGCSVRDKAERVAAAGAVALIVINTVEDMNLNRLKDDPETTMIPVLVVRASTGQALVSAIELSLTIEENTTTCSITSGKLPHEIAAEVGCSAEVTALLHMASSRRYFLGRYVLDLNLIVHRSATCIVFFADDLVTGELVALKLMKNKSEFEAEIKARVVDGIIIATSVVIGVLHWHTLAGAIIGDDRGRIQERETTPCPEHPQLAEYPHVLCMERAERSLHDACAKERIAGIRVNDIKDVMRSITHRLQQLHDHGICHGDFKQRNVVRMGKEYVLCDMDGSAKFGTPIGDKTSTAYCPPELARIKFGNPEEMSLSAADPSFDIWSLGTVLFELCSGNTLFGQDIANDELVNEDDKTRLCTWRVMSDAELESVLSAGDVQFEENFSQMQCRQVVDDAKNLIRWCLQGHPSLRPTIQQVLSHRFLSPRAGVPKAQPMRYHAFLSHAQGDASGTVATLFHEYKKLGLHCWLDMKQSILTLEGMRQGVHDSDVFILILSQRVLGSWFCQQEILCAIEAGKHIQLIVEEEPRFFPFDVATWSASKGCSTRQITPALQLKVSMDCTVSWQQSLGNDALAEHISQMIDTQLPTAVTYRRRDFEQRAMMRELCRRNGVMLPLESAELWPVGKTPICVAVLCNLDSASGMLTELREALSFAEHVTLVTDPGLLAEADRVLVLLTAGILEDPHLLGHLEEVIQIDMAAQQDRIVAMFSEAAGWKFGCDEHNSAPSVVKACIDDHEAIAYRAKDPGANCHEFPAMLAQLLRKLGAAGERMSIEAGDAVAPVVGVQRQSTEDLHRQLAERDTVIAEQAVAMAAKDAELADLRARLADLPSEGVP